MEKTKTTCPVCGGSSTDLSHAMWCAGLDNPQTTPNIRAEDVIQYVLTGHMADQTIPKWFKGTVLEFVRLYGKQLHDAGWDNRGIVEGKE